MAVIMKAEWNTGTIWENHGIVPRYDILVRTLNSGYISPMLQIELMHNVCFMPQLHVNVVAYCCGVYRW